VVEVHEGVGRPKPSLEVLSRHQLAGAFQQHSKDLEGLLLKLNPQATFANLAGAEVNLEDSEADSLALGGEANWQSPRDC